MTIHETQSENYDEIRGALGFVFVTAAMLLYIRHRLVDDEATSAGQNGHSRSSPGQDMGNRLTTRLNAVFCDSSVKKFFATWYDFPQHLDLNSASIHRVGTTSFILRCELKENRVLPGYVALKCILSPYIKDESIREATKNYSESYQPTKGYMPLVQRSTEKWIEMEFIEGETLEEVLRAPQSNPEPGDDGYSDLMIDRLRDYGEALLEALSHLPYEHLDLSPSNIIVTPDKINGKSKLVLIDFGVNYLLTQDVATGRVSPRSALYVAPELIRSRHQLKRSGREDLFSVGQILLELAGRHPTQGGYVPGDLYERAPFLGRLVDDLIDEEPNRRLLLKPDDQKPDNQRSSDQKPSDQKPDDPEAKRRKNEFAWLKKELLDELAAHEVLAKVRPSLAKADRSGELYLPFRIASRIKTALGTFPFMIETVAKPFAFMKLAKLDQKAPGNDWRLFDYFARWAFVCLCCWALVWLVSVVYLTFDLVNTSVFPAWYEVVRTVVRSVDINQLIHYERPQNPWVETVPARLVALSWGVLGVKYYLDIFAMLTTRGIETPVARRAEWLMRINAFSCPIIVVLGDLFFVRQWLLVAAVGMLPTVANNWACYRTAMKSAEAGERAFSTIYKSDLRNGIVAFGSWWRTLFAYGIGMACLGILADVGLVHDMWAFAVMGIGINMIDMYYNRCGVMAPRVRANLTRAFVTGQRLQSLAPRYVQSD